MTFILVDSNVILDIVTQDKVWFSWSFETLAYYQQQFEIAINPIIFAEISIAFNQIEDLTTLLDQFKKLALPYEACFLAGKAFIHYKQQKGLQKKPLPDFFIGAHAAISKAILMTRDFHNYPYYFPTVKLISPKKTGA